MKKRNELSLAEKGLQSLREAIAKIIEPHAA